MIESHRSSSDPVSPRDKKMNPCHRCVNPNNVQYDKLDTKSVKRMLPTTFCYSRERNGRKPSFVIRSSELKGQKTYPCHRCINPNNAQYDKLDTKSVKRMLPTTFCYSRERNDRKPSFVIRSSELKGQI